jgi:nitroreductase
MKNRRFLCVFSLMLLTGLLMPFLSGCGGVRREDFSKLIKGAEKMNVPEKIAQILGEASLAPSSHNTQQWRVKIISDTELLVLTDQARWLTQVDPENRELMLSIGAFLENLEQAALSFGYKAQTEILAKTSRETEVVRINLSPCPPVKSNILELIQARATDRRAYEKADLSASQVEELTKLLPECLAWFPRSGKEGGWLADSLVAANRQQADNDGKQKELSEWLRFSQAEAREKKDGLTPEMLGLSGIQKFYWYSFMKREDALSKSFRDKGVASARNQVDGCAGFFVITGEDNSVASLLQAGRNYEKLILKCTELSIAFQPMSQLMEESPWKDEIAKELNLSKPIQFVVRAGLSKNHPAPAIRRPVEDFIEAPMPEQPSPSPIP